MNNFGVKDFMNRCIEKNKGETEFHQAVSEVVESIAPVLEKHPEFVRLKIMDRLIEPDRVIMFRVPWVDDKGEVQVNRGFRVQFNNAIGPYKGGLRLHPSVNLGIIKFLGFEQIFKNSLTTLPMGGAKGGSDFDPKGKSDNEVMSFCHSFMRELFRHIGPDTDVPAGDIGVGGREIGFLYGFYKKIVNENTGVLTGKSLEYGGSLIRPEATGYGLVYFVQEMLAIKNQDLKNKVVAISGSGNVAQYAAEKVHELGGKVVSMCDSESTIFDEEGLNTEKIEFVKHLKNIKRGRIKEYAGKFGAKCYMGESIWDVIKKQKIHVDIALPCATQNEVDEGHAKALAENGCYCVAEGANMPSSPEAIKVYKKHNILYAPGKASNAGGVATSGLEMSQNSMRYSWTREEVDNRLKLIMKSIHEACLKASQEYGFKNDYVAGANIAGFLKVANAMKDQGIV
jgi:glutamate dehydrogenase (NADP+)